MWARRAGARSGARGWILCGVLVTTGACSTTPSSDVADAASGSDTLDDLADAPLDAIGDAGGSDASDGMVITADTERCTPVLSSSDSATVPSIDPTGCHLRDASVDVQMMWTPPPTDAGADGGGAGGLRGPGGPSVAFTTDQLNRHCAYLWGSDLAPDGGVVTPDSGVVDRDHHNALSMLDGYLIMPWAHEATPGGITVWEINDPCHPVRVGSATNRAMRETHVTGFSFVNGRWMVTASTYGIQFWDIRDFANMQMVRDFALPNTCYPDSYRRVVLSTYWQAPYVYVGTSDNGVFVVDATDPRNPRLVNQYVTGNSAGLVQAIGNHLYVHNSEGSTEHILDISDPNSPRPIPGGRYDVGDGRFLVPGVANVLPAYAGTTNGNRSYYTRHTLGGGLFIYDVSNPSMPRFLGNYQHMEMGANGGYVLIQNETAFVGLSAMGVALDISNPARPTVVTRFSLTGDLDTITPIGNVVILSVDDDANPRQSSAVVPFRADPDRRPPVVNMVVPRDGAMAQALSSRIGIGFDEFVDGQTVDRSGIIVREVGGGAAVEGYLSVQENVVNFWPVRALRPGTTYEVVIPAGGIRDYSGNPVAREFRSTFATTACR